jgi:hypothetical protein
LFRPPDLGSGSVNGLYGFVAVISSKVCTVWNRRPADVGLYLRIVIV